MRVITGSARGRRLNELKGYDTRPTTDKVKEGIFSAIQFEVEGARVLDLFAGTGQLGIEALSRGAQRAVFVDRRTDAVKLIRENLALTRLEEGAQVVCVDSMAYLNALREKFDLIFLDPPYADDLLERAVAHIARFDILAPDDEEKLELMRVSVAPLGNVEAALWNGLLTDFAAQKGARFLVRGARNSMDFDAEYQLSLIYKDVSGGALDTVLLCAEPAHQHISSTMAREMVKYHQPLEKYLPAAAAARIRGKDRG